MYKGVYIVPAPFNRPHTVSENNAASLLREEYGQCNSTTIPS
jgi:hypothetical protein